MLCCEDGGDDDSQRKCVRGWQFYHNVPRAGLGMQLAVTGSHSWTGSEARPATYRS